jgi:hypothetical protein
VPFDAKVSSADGEVRLDGQVRVNGADFGLTWNRMGMVSIHDTITVHAVFTPPISLPAPGSPPCSTTSAGRGSSWTTDRPATSAR